MVSNPDYSLRTSLFCIKRRRCFIVCDERPQGVRKYVEVEERKFIARNPTHIRADYKNDSISRVFREIFRQSVP